MVFSGVMQKYPKLKIILHHCGGTIPFFGHRMIYAQEYQKVHLNFVQTQTLKKPPVEYYKKFYADTAVSGSTPALMCGYDFFGVEHLLFGTDVPYCCEDGDVFVRNTLESIDNMKIPAREKKMIYEGNVRKLLHLDKK